MLPYHMKEERPAKAGRIVPGSVKAVKPHSEYNTHPMLLPRNPFALYPGHVPPVADRDANGRYKTRTCDLHDVNVAL